MIDNSLTPVMKKCNKPIKPKDLNHVVSMAPTSGLADKMFFSQFFPNGQRSVKAATCYKKKEQNYV